MQVQTHAGELKCHRPGRLSHGLSEAFRVPSGLSRDIALGEVNKTLQEELVDRKPSCLNNLQSVVGRPLKYNRTLTHS